MTLAARFREAVDLRRRGAAGILLGAWLAALLATPAVERGGADALTAWIWLTVLLQGLVVGLLVARSIGLRPLVATALVVFAVSFGAEALGAATDLPFGAYDYTDRLAPHVLGVPILIPVAWLMFLPPAWAVGRALAGRWGGPRFIALSAVAFTAWDLFLDPQMVAWGVWRWEEPGAYFGIPLVNYAGWLLVAGFITLLVRPRGIERRPLLVVYTLVWLIETVGLVAFWGLAGPALVGGVVMGAIALLAWRAELAETRAGDAARARAGGATDEPAAARAGAPT